MKQALQVSLNRLCRKGLLLLFAVLFTSSLFAQRTITGSVVDDENNEPLIGASVMVKSTGNGVVTNIEGNFSVSADNGEILVVSYTGYATQEVTVGAENNIIVRMGSGVQLETLVVTGYSVDTRRQTSGSVSTVKAADLKAVPSGNVEQQLQGRVPGVTVVTNGQPGTASQVRVRGFGALGGNAPLYVVDGVPVGSIDFLSPDDIETTTVLKDATAASIYGARAAGGVIVYTTKQGKKSNQKLKVTYDGIFGVTTPGNGPPVLNPQEQADWTWAAIRNAAIQNGVDPEFDHPQYGSGENPVLPDYLLVGGTNGFTGSVNLDEERANYNVDPELGAVYQVVRANTAGTDWYDAITRNAMLQRHNLGFSGGTEASRYYMGIGIQEQEGILINQDFSRYTFRVNTEFDLLPNLRIGENIQMTYRSSPLLIGDSNGAGSSDDENVILDASRMSPIIPVYDEFGGYAGTAAQGFNNPRNPVATLDGQANNKGFAAQVFGNFYLEYDPIKDLTFRTSIGGQYTSANGQSYTRRQYENRENNGAFGFNRNSFSGGSWVFTNTLNYKKSFGDSDIDVLLGQEALSFNNGRGIGASGINPFSQNTDFVNLSTLGTVNPPFEFVLAEIRFASYFGRLNYTFQDKYIFSAVVRRDGSSRFGSESRFGTFPAFSVAWRISDEPFMQGIDFLDDLKLRGGYGIMGNSNNVDPNNQFSLFGPSVGNATYDISGSNSGVANGFYRTRTGNIEARWEKAITSNFGIDALMFGGKLDVGIEFWRKDTEDLLLAAPLSVLTGGFAAVPSTNIGEMRNTGIDIQIITKGNISNDLKYEVTLNGGFLNNEIVSLVPGIDNLPNRSASYRGITPVLNQVGQPISAFYGFEVTDLWQSADEVAQANQAALAAALQANPDLTQEEQDAVMFQEGAAPGRFRFADLNGFDADGELTGSPDGKIDAADRTTLGNPVPDFTGGLTVKLNYKAFELEMYSFASIGNEVYNISKLFTDFYPLFPGAAISDRVKDSWSFSNPTGEIPLFENTSNFSTNTQSNSFYVEDGSYFRMQNITLGYYLPSDILERMKLSKLRVFASVNNVFTISGYDGLDPSVGGAADTNFGIDLGNYPITRSWTFGVNLGF